MRKTIAGFPVVSSDAIPPNTFAIVGEREAVLSDGKKIVRIDDSNALALLKLIAEDSPDAK